MKNTTHVKWHSLIKYMVVLLPFDSCCRVPLDSWYRNPLWPTRYRDHRKWPTILFTGINPVPSIFCNTRVRETSMQRLINIAEEILENIQHRATKMVPELKEMEYTQRLCRMRLHSLYYRHDRGDMIECYKMTHDCYDISPILRKDDNKLRGHSYKLQLQGSSKDVRHNFFSLRCVRNWNSLPELVVSAPSL